MDIASISTQYQICISKKIREQVRIKSGKKFILIPKGEYLKLAPKRNIKKFKGILADANTENIRDRKDRR